jgi:hypothetical protein
MLTGVPEDYEFWVRETAIRTDQFWPGTQAAFYEFWWGSESLEDYKAAVLVTVERWALNVVDGLKLMVGIFEDSEERRRRVRKQVARIRSEPRSEQIEDLLACALSPGESPSPEGPPTEHLPFELLPPGESLTTDLINRVLNNLSRRSPGGWQASIDPSRLTNLLSLNPSKCYVGTRDWMGYVLFEFEPGEKVVLECPIEGNATYILSGEWRELVGCSKSHLREYYPERTVRVIHKGDWLGRVQQALR